ncbi:MAG: hypothetical protein ABSF74_01705 [Dehalococcoidia bacterium]
MPAKVKANKGEVPESELHLLQAASKEIHQLDSLKDIFNETSELVSRHNQLARRKIIPTVGPTRVNWSEITRRAGHLIARLASDEYKFIALTALEKGSNSLLLKEELTRLLHIISSLISEYTEILTVIDQYPQTMIMMLSSEVEHLDEASYKVSQLIQSRIKPAVSA